MSKPVGKSLDNIKPGVDEKPKSKLEKLEENAASAIRELKVAIQATEEQMRQVQQQFNELAARKSGFEAGLKKWQESLE